MDMGFLIVLVPEAKKHIFSEDILASAYLVVGFRVLVDVRGGYLAQGRTIPAGRKIRPELE